MSRIRTLGILAVAYLAFVLVYPRYESDLLDRIIASPTVHRSHILSRWVDGITSRDCQQSACTCAPSCAGNRRLDWGKPWTVATGVFAGTFVLTPFVSRHLVFVKAFDAARPGLDVAVRPERGTPFMKPRDDVSTTAPRCGHIQAPMDPLWVAAIAVAAMFAACTTNFALGTAAGWFAQRPKVAMRWASLIDRWGVGILALGFLFPAGFPIGLASLYLGFRRERIGAFLMVAALGCACHVIVLMAVYENMMHLLNL